jgi:acetolactate synthase I/II/III large subunit
VIRLADYVFQRVASWGVRDVFLLTGGGAMHLNDAVGRQTGIRYVCMHHEQACAMAAEAYARESGKIGVISVTTGPGAINALNGVFGAWTDSIPMLVISGQVKRATCLANYGDKVNGLRQLGDQEVDIVGMASGITKYARIVMEPASIRYHLERAYYLATHGRPGPVWLDIPVDVQATQIDESSLPAYDSDEDRIEIDETELRRKCEEIAARMQTARRPVILAGSGVRLARAEAAFRGAICRLGIPVTTGWTAPDILPSDHPLHCGRPGTIGDRPGNFAVQNADLLLVLGCRLNIRQISYDWKAFAPGAYQVHVDIDAAELCKPTVRPDLAVHSDLRLFLEMFNDVLAASAYQPGMHREWLGWCRERAARYPVVLPRHRACGPPVNPYHFVDQLFERLGGGDTVICGNGTASVVAFQAARLRENQRLFANSGSASMGYDLPAAIGAAVAKRGRRVICLAGEGSIQLNIQELQTVVHHRLPIKIFVLNNGGYLSIRTTQASHFAGNFVGEGPESGVTFPNMVRLAAAYGIPALRITRGDCGETLDSLLEEEGPSLCEVMLDPAQGFEPRLTSRMLPDGSMVSSRLEDLYPFLDVAEARSNWLGDSR